MIDFQRMRILIRDEERLRWAVIREEAKATKITTSLSKSGGGGKGRTSSKVEDGAIALAILKSGYQQTANELEKMRSELRKRLHGLTGLEKSVIRMRYIEGMSCADIALKIHYDKCYMHHVVRRAEIKVNKRRKHDQEDSNSRQ